MVNEQLIPILVLFSEIGLILALVTIVVVSIYVKRARRLRKLSQDLSDQFKQQMNPRKEEIETLLNKVYSIDAQTASEAINNLFLKEKTTYEHILKSIFGKDKEHALYLYKDIKGLINDYQILPLTYAIHSDVIEKNSSDMVNKSELDNLQSKLDTLLKEHETVSQELSDTKELLERTQREYRSMYPAIYGEAEPGTAPAAATHPEALETPSPPPPQSFLFMDPLETESDDGNSEVESNSTEMSLDAVPPVVENSPDEVTQADATDSLAELDESKIPTLMDHVEPTEIVVAEQLTSAEAEITPDNEITAVALDSIPVLDDMVLPHTEDSARLDELSKEALADLHPSVDSTESGESLVASSEEKLSALDGTKMDEEQKAEKQEIEALLDGLEDLGVDDLANLSGEDPGITDPEAESMEEAPPPKKISQS